MATRLKSVRAMPDPLDGMSLPGWLYHDAEFFKAEQAAFLRAAPRRWIRWSRCARADGRTRRSGE